ncbi:MAG TPA: hypothetical protein VF768_11155 [Holophagaceae bacterium]
MRAIPVVLALCGSALVAQVSQPATLSRRSFSFGLQVYGPTLTGHFQGVQNGQPISLDLDSDLGLGKDKTTPGVFFDYQGPRFAFQVGSGTADYRGDRTLKRDITLNGTTYHATDRVLSHVKLASVDGTWTIKLVRSDAAFLGLDLGVQVWKLDLDAHDAPPPPMTATYASTSVTAPIPQFGLSAGVKGFEDRLEAKAFFHYLGYKSAKYTRTGVDVRFFPVHWLGLRAFYDGGSFDVPKGSIKDDLELNLDRKGGGFGAVLRF